MLIVDMYGVYQHVHVCGNAFNSLCFNIQCFSSSASSVRSKTRSLSQHLASIDPDFYEYLQENDSNLLEEMADSEASLDDGEAELMEDDQSATDDDDLGTAEPRPLNITNRKEVSHCS